jgi:hypothetical protein
VLEIYFVSRYSRSRMVTVRSEDMTPVLWASIFQLARRDGAAVEIVNA